MPWSCSTRVFTNCIPNDVVLRKSRLGGKAGAVVGHDQDVDAIAVAMESDPGFDRRGHP